MADLTLTGPVTRGDGDPADTGKAQVAINAGEAVYIDTANNRNFNLCDADVEASAVFHGIAVSSAGIGEDCTVARPGAVITVANTPFSPGVVVYLSTTAGGLTSTWADLTTGDYVSVALIGITTSTAMVLNVVSGVVKA